MQTKESFLIFYFILKVCYFKCRENDLRIILGAISPELWDDGKAMDTAIFEEWANSVKGKNVSSKNILNEVCQFLKYYEYTYNFDFSRTKAFLSDCKQADIVKKALDEASEWKQKYYSDYLPD